METHAGRGLAALQLCNKSKLCLVVAPTQKLCAAQGGRVVGASVHWVPLCMFPDEDMSVRGNGNGLGQ